MLLTFLLGAMTLTQRGGEKGEWEEVQEVKLFFHYENSF